MTRWIRQALLLHFTAVLLSTGSTASAQKCQNVHSRLTRQSEIPDRSSIRRSLRDQPEILWLTPLLGEPLPGERILEQRLDRVQQEESQTQDPAQKLKIKSWEMEKPIERDLRGRVVIANPVLQSGFDQNYSFYATGNAVIHVPHSPDMFFHVPKVYLFEGSRLQQSLTLDEWILQQFQSQFGEKIVLYRTMSERQADFYRKKDAKGLIQDSEKKRESNTVQYNIDRPALHFSAEEPISWTTNKDRLFRFEIPVKELIQWVRKNQARVGLYGPMIEVQVFTAQYPAIVAAAKEAPPRDIENMTSEQIEAYLRSLDLN